jgi:hypothetical protein
MHYAGTNVPGETIAEQGDRQGLRTAMYGGGLAGLDAHIPDVVGYAPTLAATVNHLFATVGAPYGQCTQETRYNALRQTVEIRP